MIYLNKVKVWTSGVAEGVKKSDNHIWFVLPKPQLLCGDIRIEFYNKPKMTRKVLSGLFCSRGFYCAGCSSEQLEYK